MYICDNPNITSIFLMVLYVNAAIEIKMTTTGPIHKLPQYFDCKYCTELFVEQLELHQHYRKTHNCLVRMPQPSVRKRLYYKIVTDGGTVDPEVLLLDDDPGRPNCCLKCDKRFLNGSILTCHLMTHLLGRKRYDCVICDTDFHHARELEEHLPQHRVGAVYRCPFCSMTHENYSKIREHAMNWHLMKRQYCPICQEGFDDVRELKEHSSLHADRRAFVCTICKSRFPEKKLLQTHCIRDHSESMARVTDSRETERPVLKMCYMRS